ncbi:MAG TPA: anhydro-N-acetylmuramic acid kinase [Phycisphaerae bacterium]|nr:anhydro-N-acetylmuramic acid kinase [Phycisphaerae bacterium]
MPDAPSSSLRPSLPCGTVRSCRHYRLQPMKAKAPSRQRLSDKHADRDRHVLGLMSGTSGDGIDAACVRIAGRGENMRVEMVLHHHQAFAPSLRRRLAAAMAPAETTTQEIARLHADLGEAFARAAQAAIRKLPRTRRPTLIGSAGQTVCHLPDRRPGRTVTLQLGDPARVAALTGRPVVADFRQSDVAAGGQGAPLVPWTDWVLFRHPRIHRLLLNIGGIANLTWLPAGARSRDVVAFDTGPGNMIIDAMAALAGGGREHMDRDGRRAARGRILEPVLKSWLQHPFLSRRPPRSTGREEFGRPFIAAELPRLKRAGRSPDDWIATATAFTACCVANACRRWLGLEAAAPSAWLRSESNQLAGTGRALRGRPAAGPSVEMILCGGGAKNPVLTGFLAECLRNVTIRPIDSFGIPAQAKEALSFAMLAAARVDGVPADLPRVTGATRPAVLGHLTSPTVGRALPASELSEARP